MGMILQLGMSAVKRIRDRWAIVAYALDPKEPMDLQVLHTFGQCKVWVPTRPPIDPLFEPQPQQTRPSM